MKILAGLLSLSLLVVAPTAMAQRPAAAAAASGSMQCDPSRATAARVSDVAGDPKAWLGKCVTVKGVYSDERLYASAADAKAKKTSIGGYVNLSVYAEGIWSGEFTGRVTDCEQQQNDLDTGLLRSPGISLMGRVLGCITPEGPFLLFMSQGKLTKAG